MGRGLPILRWNLKLTRTVWQSELCMHVSPSTLVNHGARSPSWCLGHIYKNQVTGGESQGPRCLFHIPLSLHGRDSWCAEARYREISEVLPAQRTFWKTETWEPVLSERPRVPEGHMGPGSHDLCWCWESSLSWHDKAVCWKLCVFCMLKK